LVIGADTIVVSSETEEIIEKPLDPEDAFSMLKKLSGKPHWVYTGVALVRHCEDFVMDSDLSSQQVELVSKFLPSSKLHIEGFSVKTEVRFANLSDDVIRAYVDTKEPLDKAGGVSDFDRIDWVYLTCVVLVCNSRCWRKSD
jgi:septum formation protein